MWWAQKTCFLSVLQVAGRVMLLGASDKEYRRLAWNWSLGQEDSLKGREDPPCKESSLGSANPRLLTWLVQTWVCGPDSQRPAAELSSSDPEPGNRRSFCTIQVDWMVLLHCPAQRLWSPAVSGTVSVPCQQGARWALLPPPHPLPCGHWWAWWAEELPRWGYVDGAARIHSSFVSVPYTVA